MSATPTSSDAPARRWKAWAPAWLVILHRYLGITVGALMLLWCLSGMVMLFVHYPQVGEGERLAGLARIDWSRCCNFGEAMAAGEPIAAASLEDLAGAPVLRLRTAGGERRAIDLSTGRDTGKVPEAVARQVARQACGGCEVAAVTPVVRDQWTVSGEFNRDRPLWRVRLADGRGTDLYVSSSSGKLVQHTTAASRVLSWLGPVPHWLYPQILRQDAKLWTQVVIWTSLLGCFLTLTGLYLGVVAWRPFRDRRLSPYRGLMTWHHLASLAAGVLTLTWVASGLFSMNPWGFLEGQGDPAVERLAGPPPTFGDLEVAIVALAAQRPTVAQVRAAPFAGRLYLMAGDARFDAAGRPAALGPGELAAAGRTLGQLAGQGRIGTGDAYYFSHHDTVQLPAWRVVRTDGLRVYLDPRSGEVLSVADAGSRGFRWLHLGLHRLDVLPGLDRGPLWAAAMLLLLGAVTLGVGAGVWLAWRRVQADLHGLLGR